MWSIAQRLLGVASEEGFQKQVKAARGNRGLRRFGARAHLQKRGWRMPKDLLPRRAGLRHMLQGCGIKRVASHGSHQRHFVITRMLFEIGGSGYGGLFPRRLVCESVRACRIALAQTPGHAGHI